MFHHQNLGGNRAALVILSLVGVRMAINLVQGIVCRSECTECQGIRSDGTQKSC
jgi:hypothetical protein